MKCYKLLRQHQRAMHEKGKVRHVDALDRCAAHHNVAFEAGFVGILMGLITFADQHEIIFEAPIATDHIIGPAWLMSMKQLRKMLQVDVGRIDRNEMDFLLFSLVCEAGFKRNDLEGIPVITPADIDMNWPEPKPEVSDDHE